MEFNVALLMPAPKQFGVEDVSQFAPDTTSLDKNDIRLVEFREKIGDFQKQFEAGLESGDLTPSPYSYKHHFTGVHSEFGAALYGREMHLSKGAVVIGKIHKHPVLNVLLKGKLAVVSENGKRVIEAPCVYSSDPNIRRVGHVLEDCIWLNVLMTKHVGEENLDTIIGDHTADSYEEVGLFDSVDALQKAITTVI
jgi:hypothetical protein